MATKDPYTVSVITDYGTEKQRARRVIPGRYGPDYYNEMAAKTRRQYPDSTVHLLIHVTISNTVTVQEKVTA